jgi:hypothetical protein
MPIGDFQFMSANDQLTNTVVMVRPNHFGFNPQTAGSNVFQHQVSESEIEVQKKALGEFDNAVKKLEAEGIKVLILESREDAITPDSLFPNNWFSHHSDGKLIIYPMLAPNRRAERQTTVLKELLRKNNINISEVIDLTSDETKGAFLEGTGSLVLDRQNSTAFAMESPRTVKGEFNRWCDLMGYEGIFFDAYDQDGFPIYHTNVTMSIGREYAVVCFDSIKDKADKNIVENKLKDLGKDIIELSIKQIYQYCGNTLQVLSVDGEAKIIMSETAFQGFNYLQLERLRRYGKIITFDIPEIETVGGGSARCMLAEIFK